MNCNRNYETPKRFIAKIFPSSSIYFHFYIPFDKFPLQKLTNYRLADFLSNDYGT